MNDPEKNTAQQSGDQETPESQTSAVDTSTDKISQELPSYFQSEDALKTRINELSSIANSSNVNSEEVQNATKEIEEITSFLEKAKDEHGTASTEAQKTPEPQNDLPPIPTAKDGGQEKKQPEEKGEKEDSSTPPNPNKFFVTYQGQRYERDDPNKLLGFKTTGDLKAGYIKENLRADGYRSQIDDLSRKLQEAEEKLKAAPPPEASQQQGVPPSTPPSLSRQTPASSQTRPRPRPPVPPKLSTNNPIDYTDNDLEAKDRYEKEMARYTRNLDGYLDNLENRVPSQLPPDVRKEIDEVRNWKKDAENIISDLKADRERLSEEAEENKHWQRFDSFQQKHKSFETPIPARELNSKVNEWMDNIAAANGVHRPDSNNEADMINYANRRADIVDRYMSQDQEVLNNAQGYTPPEGHDAYFRLAELYASLEDYINQGKLGKGASLEEAYLLKMNESGEFRDRMEKLRVQERTEATKQFSEAIDEHQNYAANVPPEQSAPAPEASALGITSEQFNWFRSIGREQYLALQKDPEKMKLYNAIADRIERYYGTKK